jgi:hypothetical protein
MRDFIGATAPWANDAMDDDEDVLRRIADTLAHRLNQRLETLREPSADDVILEIRRQIADCAFDDPIRASDLAGFILEVLSRREK